MSVSYSLEEQETTINVFPSTVSKQAEIFTCIPSMINKMRKLAEENPHDVAIRESDGCVFCTVPVDWIRIAPKRKCTLTDEQKKANAERLAAYREAKLNATS